MHMLHAVELSNRSPTSPKYGFYARHEPPARGAGPKAPKAPKASVSRVGHFLFYSSSSSDTPPPPAPLPLVLLQKKSASTTSLEMWLWYWPPNEDSIGHYEHIPRHFLSHPNLHTNIPPPLCICLIFPSLLA